MWLHVKQPSLVLTINRIISAKNIPVYLSLVYFTVNVFSKNNIRHSTVCVCVCDDFHAIR